MSPPLQKKEILDIFRKYKSDNEIFHDLMPVRMREILVVATIYDAFTLEQDGLISEMIFTEFYQLNLFHAPRITSVSSAEDALDKLKTRHFDLVIIISRLHREDSALLSQTIKGLYPNIPILLLLNDNAEIGEVSKNRQLFTHFDNVFVWNGNSEVFLAMIKYVEDRANVYNDTHIGLVRVILLVEDSIRYYSRYLPTLYAEVLKQTQRLVNEDRMDELKKVLRRRARPKVLLASTYEEAMNLAELFKDYLLCVISDVAYAKEGKIDDFAGIKLMRELKGINPDLPVLLQSSEPENAHTADFLGASFINKESESLTRDLTNFFYYSLGFGDFIFRNQHGHEIARARTMEELRGKLNQVPAESIVYHASRNHFSAWLMARGEIQIAHVVFKTKVEDFKNAEDLRSFLINVGESIRSIRVRGKVTPLDETYVRQEHHISRLAEGSLGGKGRGIAFVNSLLSHFNLADRIPRVNISIPQTSILGTDEFTRFLDSNRLTNILRETSDHDSIKRRFLTANLSEGTQNNLRRFLENVTHPIAVRSSGMLEDSLSHPLSGVYQTFFLPNSHPDPQVRLNQVMEAIKLVYASVYSKTARAYFEAIDYKIEEEKMAVVLQEVVGRKFGTHFYPHLSGVAQSYNFYPFSYIKPEDGVCMIAVGLGKYVVGGEKSFRFCPRYPQLDLATTDEQIKNSQRHFYALDLERNLVDLFNGDDATLKTLQIEDAEKDGALDHSASVWDIADQCMRPGLNARGPRVINFPSILKFEEVPLAKSLEVILDIVEKSMESPVEIEFAMDLEPGANGLPTFHILQIKHLLRDVAEGTIKVDNVKPEQLLLSCQQAMGHGVLRDLTDLVWIDPARFDKGRTQEMVAEIEQINIGLRREGRRFILLGPGRWGTRDRWLGIPITWPQISHAKVIVEYALADFQVDSSLGSHFFHNVTSMNIGYFSVPFGSSQAFIDWDWIRAQPVLGQTGFFTHSRLTTPMHVLMDGRQGLGMIFKETPPDNED